MKTTIDLSPALLERAKRLAVAESTTLRALVEAGLARILEEHSAHKKPFVLGDGSVAGRGLSPEFEEAGWAEIRDAIYSERRR